MLGLTNTNQLLKQFNEAINLIKIYSLRNDTVKLSKVTSFKRNSIHKYQVTLNRFFFANKLIIIIIIYNIPLVIIK